MIKVNINYKKIYIIANALLIFFFLCACSLVGEVIPAHRVIPSEQLAGFLREEVLEQLKGSAMPNEELMASFLRDKFAERYFYDWHSFTDRFQNYTAIYRNQSDHEARALDHMSKFADSTNWKLPFNYISGCEVNAYEYRHLARQHKMVDVAFQYFYSGKDLNYLHYFTRQLRSLNTALSTGQYEKIEDGNGVFEVFRAGYRVLNWLFVHTLFLNEEGYSDHDQLTTISTLLQHGALLYEENEEFQPGNHQTRGVSALAMLAILFRDFQGADLWYERAITRLTEHMDREINGDGFQFERSVHYHMSDIDNYFYVYQLAHISGIELEEKWEIKMRSLFSTLTRLAYPDRSAPVLQDDTDIPWAEYNDISNALTLGYVLYGDPVYGYFASNKVEDKLYWYLTKEQLDQLDNPVSEKPMFKSLAFSKTGYYVMREGWEMDDKMMIISAGLEREKPDHQHGDMLGVQAMAYGQIILPNYQVRYSLNDFELFKNSLVKNVALVDQELQGKQWTSNKGGSGFGKFKKVPIPQIIVWEIEPEFDLFVGSHDGFRDLGVDYFRQVIFIRDDFWVIKDHFVSGAPHTYKQVWQGHYTTENGPGLLRSVFGNAAGCDIFQLNDVNEVVHSGVRGKEWSIIEKNAEDTCTFITIIFPFQGYDHRINEAETHPNLKGWKLNKLSFQAAGDQIRSLQKDRKSYLFSVRQVTIRGIQLAFSSATDLYVWDDLRSIRIVSLANSEANLRLSGCGSMSLNGKLCESDVVFKPGDHLECSLK